MAQRAVHLALAAICGLSLALQGTPTPASSTADGKFFITNLAIRRYVQGRGGVKTFGQPVSQTFILGGRTSQLFQRALLQLDGQGNVQPGNLLDDALGNLAHVGGLSLPPLDRQLAASAPAPGTPDYAARMLAFLQSQVPDVFEGQPVNFLQTFITTATLGADADFNLRLLVGLEVWGVPISHPTRDPNNADFVYQRFQRGIMHYQGNKGVTEGLLVGDWLKQVITAQGLPPDLASASSGSPYLRQYDVATDKGPLRPAELAGTMMDGAFQPAQADPRFGVVVVGQSDAQSVAAALATLGAGSWYSFSGNVNLPGRAELLHPSDDLQAAAARAKATPGRAWLIANEPNVPQQDTLSPSDYADFLARAAVAIKGADPSARLVGPNVLNWDGVCNPCPSQPTGHAWSQQFADVYQQRYGRLPFDAWGLHTYSLNWANPPLIDAAADKRQVVDCRAWLDAHGMAGTPIWITEFGIIWGFEGARIETQNGRTMVQPSGPLREDLMADYLNTMLSWLLGPAPVERWFLYATTPQPEPYATVVGGITLLAPNALTLTPLGQRYHFWASLT